MRKDMDTFLAMGVHTNEGGPLCSTSTCKIRGQANGTAWAKSLLKGRHRRVLLAGYRPCSLVGASQSDREMAVRGIVLYTDNKAALRKKSRPVKGVDRRVRNLMRDLNDTLEHSPAGIGLAAPQIGVHRRVIVVRLGSRNGSQMEPDPPIALINPKIVDAAEEQRDFDGCLSFPGLYAETVRPHYLRVTGLDERGKSFDRVFDGFDAVVVHHEVDHLDGVLFIDRVERLEDLYKVTTDGNGQLVRAPVGIRR
jgi:peptide deformylase